MRTTTKKLETNWSGKMSNNKKIRKTGIFNLSSSHTHIWKSNLSWSITLIVFLTIMFVHASILALSVKNEELKLLGELREKALSSITPMIDFRIQGELTSPIKQYYLNRIVSTTIIQGMVIYNSDREIIEAVGQPLAMTLGRKDSLNKTYRSYNGESYEVIFTPNELGTNFIILAKLDSISVKEELKRQVWKSITIMLLLSGFVTTVLMIALGKWLLEPIMFLKQDLEEAYKNPENPDISTSPYDEKNEIGSAIKIAQELIKENANNLKKIKSTAQDKIHKLAYYDSLTNLPNRVLFIQKLYEQSKLVADGKQKSFAVVALDIDHFKDINDSMGHNIGDAILRAIGKRLRLALPESATIARIGEDEFAITMPLGGSVQKAVEVGEKIQSVIKSEPFKVFNENFQIRASIGVSTFPTDSKDPDQVLKNADIALNRAKEDGRDTIREYLKDFDEVVQQRFQMLRDLRNAMENEELQLHYQPQFDMKTGKIIGAEALLRWWKKDNSKEGGKFISPGVFVPIAEQSGLIVPIGNWVTNKACKTAIKWQNEGHNIRIAINVAAAQFQQSDIVSNMQQVIDETGINPHLVELEVTESVFMDDIKHTVHVLDVLHSMGVELAIDDFGTGYSSLSYLRQFPIDRLKIDQSFIRNALENPDDAAITRTIIKLGHSLNLKVIAEGVETKDHEKFLIEQECDEVQGFKYSRPLPEDKFLEFINNYNGNLDSLS